MRTITEFKDDYVDNLENSGMLTKVDIIEQNLNAIDAAIEFSQKWISVNEEPMPKNVIILTKCDNDNKKISLCRWNESLQAFSPIINDISWCTITLVGITHWRPIEII